MRKNEIDALVRAHRGEVRPVAFLHVLRQTKLEPDDHAFLQANIDQLGAADLLRWRSRCEPGFTGAVIAEIGRRAVADPVTFRHEILDAPRLDFEEAEWRELADVLRGKIPDEVLAIVLERGGPRPARAPSDQLFSPRVIARESVEFEPADLDDGVRVDVEAATRLPLAKVLAKKRAHLLDLDDEQLRSVALEKARGTDEDWSVLAADFPPAWQEVVLEKARRTPRASERANLLSWLERYEAPRAALFPIALRSTEEADVGPSFGVIAWLARQLSTRSAWDKHGLETISALLRQRALAELGELITMVVGDARSRAEGDTKKPASDKIVEAVHGAFAEALVGEAKDALVTRDRPRARAALSALVCLDPPSRVSRAVHELERIDGNDEDLTELIAVNVRLVKHGDARGATLEGVVAALHALSDVLSSR
ncbi:MAG: hypothetical protein U0414_29285 [Polyangiaceae bacterium]